MNQNETSEIHKNIFWTRQLDSLTQEAEEAEAEEGEAEEAEAEAEGAAWEGYEYEAPLKTECQWKNHELIHSFFL